MRRQLKMPRCPRTLGLLRERPSIRWTFVHHEGSLLGEQCCGKKRILSVQSVRAVPLAFGFHCVVDVPVADGALRAVPLVSLTKETGSHSRGRAGKLPAKQMITTILVWLRARMEATPWGKRTLTATLGCMAIVLGVWPAAVWAAPFAATQAPGPISQTNATLNGMASPNGLSTVAWFEWGTNAGYGQRSDSANVGGGKSVRRVSTIIVGLIPSATYRYRLVVSNAAGVALGIERRFTTGRKVAAWGDNRFGQTNLPAGLGNATAISSGDVHGLAITQSGTLIGWGDPTDGAAAVPPGLTNVGAFAGCGFFSLAARPVGTVVAWGDNTYGETRVPAGLSNVVAVAGGGRHALALRADGTVVAWGWNYHHQTDVPAGLSNVVAISAMIDHSLALRNDGVVIAWGDNFFGQSTVPAQASNVVAVAAGGWHSLALKADGTVLLWGQSGSAVPAGLSNVVAIAGGVWHSLALRADGTVVGWGDNRSGQATAPFGLNNVVDISGGYLHSLALAPNVPPRTTSQTATGTTNQPLTLTLTASDVNSDPLTLRITSLPPQGRLFQYTTNGPGERITAPDTPLADAQRRVLFVPDPDGMGSPYASFSYVANDGEADSLPATVTIHVLPPPQIESYGFSSGTNSAFELQFTGLPGAAYRVQASTNLVNWQVLGPASENPTGWFRFSDTQSTNWTRRFYRLSSP